MDTQLSRNTNLYNDMKKSLEDRAINAVMRKKFKRIAMNIPKSAVEKAEGHMLPITALENDEDAQPLMNRIEDKYLLPRKCLDKALDTLRAHLGQGDVDTSTRYNNNTTVYLDNKDLICFRDAIDKAMPRFKVRIRHYENESGPENVAYVELKIAEEERSKKLRVRILRKDIESIAAGKELKSSDSIIDINKDISKDKLWNRIAILNTIISKYGLTKRMEVSYERRAFSDNEIRVTIDDKIHYKAFASIEPSMRDTITKSDHWIKQVKKISELSTGEWVILEVKHDDNVPKWLRHMLKDCEAEEVKISKYVSAVTKQLISGNDGTLLPAESATHVPSKAEGIDKSETYFRSLLKATNVNSAQQLNQPQMPAPEPNPLRHWKVKHDPAKGIVHFNHALHGTISIKKHPRAKIRQDNPFAAVHNGKSVGKYPSIKEAVAGVAKYAKTLDNKKAFNPMLNVDPMAVGKSEDLSKRSKNVREQTRGITSDQRADRMNSLIRRMGFRTRQSTQDRFGVGPDQKTLTHTANAGLPEHELAHALMTPEGMSLRHYQKELGQVNTKSGVMTQDERHKHERNAFLMQPKLARMAGVKAQMTHGILKPDPKKEGHAESAAALNRFTSGSHSIDKKGTVVRNLRSYLRKDESSDRTKKLLLLKHLLSVLKEHPELFTEMRKFALNPNESTPENHMRLAVYHSHMAGHNPKAPLGSYNHDAEMKNNLHSDLALSHYQAAGHTRQAAFAEHAKNMKEAHLTPKDANPPHDEMALKLNYQKKTGKRLPSGIGYDFTS